MLWQVFQLTQVVSTSYQEVSIYYIILRVFIGEGAFFNEVEGMEYSM